VTHPDYVAVDGDDDEGEAGLDPSRISVARSSDANEGDLIEQAMAVPLGDDDGFDR
jgi:hypothetical protein